MAIAAWACDRLCHVALQRSHVQRRGVVDVHDCAYPTAGCEEDMARLHGLVISDVCGR